MLTGVIRMARRPKLTQEMVDEAIRLKADGLSNGDIVCALATSSAPWGSMSPRSTAGSEIPRTSCSAS